MPREFYANELTEASRRVVERFMDEYPEAILIGGWGTWLRLRTLLSHDVDVILKPPDLARVRAQMRFTETTHPGGRKYRATAESGIKLDIYVPYQSELGRRLRLPVAALLPHVEVVGSRKTLTVSAHLVTKLAALLDRPESNPGEKDRAEIWGLLPAADPREFADVVRHARAAEAAGLVGEGFQLLGDMRLNRQERQQLRVWASQYEDAVLGRHLNSSLDDRPATRRRVGRGRSR